MSESSNSGVLSSALLLPLRRISLISSSSDVGSFAMIPAREQPCQVVRWEKGVRNAQGILPACRREQGWWGAQGPCLTIGVGLVKLVVVLLGSSLHPQGSPLQGNSNTQGEPLPLSGGSSTSGLWQPQAQSPRIRLHLERGLWGSSEPSPPGRPVPDDLDCFLCFCQMTALRQLQSQSSRKVLPASQIIPRKQQF